MFWEEKGDGVTQLINEQRRCLQNAASFSDIVNDFSMNYFAEFSSVVQSTLCLQLNN